MILVPKRILMFSYRVWIWGGQWHSIIFNVTLKDETLTRIITLIGPGQISPPKINSSNLVCHFWSVQPEEDFSKNYKGSTNLSRLLAQGFTHPPTHPTISVSVSSINALGKRFLLFPLDVLNILYFLFPVKLALIWVLESQIDRSGNKCGR